MTQTDLGFSFHLTFPNKSTRIKTMVAELKELGISVAQIGQARTSNFNGRSFKIAASFTRDGRRVAWHVWFDENQKVIKSQQLDLSSESRSESMWPKGYNPIRDTDDRRDDL